MIYTGPGESGPAQCKGPGKADPGYLCIYSELNEGVELPPAPLNPEGAEVPGPPKRPAAGCRRARSGAPVESHELDQRC